MPSLISKAQLGMDTEVGTKKAAEGKQQKKRPRRSPTHDRIKARNAKGIDAIHRQMEGCVDDAEKMTDLRERLQMLQRPEKDLAHREHERELIPRLAQGERLAGMNTCLQQS